MRLAADHIKRLSLELGGQSPLLVLDDADLSKVVPAAVRRSYSNSGQICIAVNRVFVADAVADDFADAFVDLARRLRIGYGLDEGVEFGPLANEPTRQRSADHVADARARGATVALGGAPPEGDAYARGYYYAPTVLTGTDQSMLVMRRRRSGR